MTDNRRKDYVSFVLSVMFYHFITYFVMGIFASNILDYKNAFLQPIIRDYYKPINSIAVYVGPVMQLVRGLLFGLVLLPFRSFIKENKLSWLWIWLLFIVIGIIGTPAASPSSVEGVIYSKIPMWFHLFGLPEILIQTLLFIFFVQRKLRAKEHPFPEFIKKSLVALVSACISFIGYTVISIVFALFSGVGISKSNANIQVLGLFIAPLLIIFILTLLKKPNDINIRHILMYVSSVIAIAVYQQVVFDSAGILYVLIAPIIPVIISYVLEKNSMKKL